MKLRADRGNTEELVCSLLIVAIESELSRRGITAAAAAKSLDLSPSWLIALRKGHAPGIGTFIRIVRWLGASGAAVLAAVNETEDGLRLSAGGRVFCVVVPADLDPRRANAVASLLAAVSQLVTPLAFETTPTTGKPEEVCTNQP